MEPDKNKEPDQSHTTDPQEDEKNGNVLGKIFDAVFGDAHGGGSVSDEEDKLPHKQESIKDSPAE
jgi:hypothetical protein